MQVSWKLFLVGGAPSAVGNHKQLSDVLGYDLVTSIFLLHGHKLFTGNTPLVKFMRNYTSGLEWRIFHILTSKDITEIKFVS